MRIGVVGTRTYPRLDWVHEFILRLPSHDLEGNVNILVSGRGRGVDKAAEEKADSRRMPKLIFEPNYIKYGRYVAPKMRNTKIADNSEVLVAFWDEKSTGTLDTMIKSRARNTPVIVVEPNGNVYCWNEYELMDTVGIVDDIFDYAIYLEFFLKDLLNEVSRNP